MPGFASNVPQTDSDNRTLTELHELMIVSMMLADQMELWVNGQPASVLFRQIAKYLGDQTIKFTNKQIRQ